MNDSRNKVIAVIPARGASKGLARKNVLPLGGKPLIAWTIEAAVACNLVQRVIVSTDDAEIAEIARKFGAETPFVRPADIATDAASTEAVLRHAIQWLEEHEAATYDILLYLQATDPFRRSGIVGEVIQALIDDPTLDSAFAARPEHKNYWTLENGQYQRLGRHSYLPRQQKPPVFREDTGVALATRVEVVKQGKRIGDRVRIIPHDCDGDFIDIHNSLDLWIADQLIQKQGIKPNGESSRTNQHCRRL